MDALPPGERTRLCSVLSDRYRSCVTQAAGEVITQADTTLVTRRCGSLFAALSEQCAEQIRSGAVARAAAVALPLVSASVAPR